MQKARGVACCDLDSDSDTRQGKSAGFVTDPDSEGGGDSQRGRGQTGEKKTTNNNLHAVTHPFFLVTMCTFLRREGARRVRKRDGER